MQVQPHLLIGWLLAAIALWLAWQRFAAASRQIGLIR